MGERLNDLVMSLSEAVLRIKGAAGTHRLKSTVRRLGASNSVYVTIWRQEGIKHGWTAIVRVSDHPQHFRVHGGRAPDIDFDFGVFDGADGTIKRFQAWLIEKLGPLPLNANQINKAKRAEEKAENRRLEAERRTAKAAAAVQDSPAVRAAQIHREIALGKEAERTRRHEISEASRLDRRARFCTVAHQILGQEVVAAIWAEVDRLEMADHG